ncbi:MAG: hypothetical protein ACJ71F_03395 [Nitrososphaeraceae archaeon]
MRGNLTLCNVIKFYNAGKSHIKEVRGLLEIFGFGFKLILLVQAGRTSFYMAVIGLYLRGYYY